jgi:hypothetical protein
MLDHTRAADLQNAEQTTAVYHTLCLEHAVDDERLLSLPQPQLEHVDLTVHGGWPMLSA